MKIRNTEGYMDAVAYKAIMNVDREKKAAERPAFRPLVYVCVSFSGDIEGNKKKATEFAHFAYKQGCILGIIHLMLLLMNDRRYLMSARPFEKSENRMMDLTKLSSTKNMDGHINEKSSDFSLQEFLVTFLSRL